MMNFLSFEKTPKIFYAWEKIFSVKFTFLKVMVSILKLKHDVIKFSNEGS